MHRFSFAAFVFFLILSANASAQKASSYYHFRGMLEGKYPLTMDLELSDTTASGFLSYDKSGIPVYVSGALRGNTIFLDEFAIPDSLTGRIKAQLDKGTLKGIWTSPDAKKEYSLDMKEDYSGSFYLERIRLKKSIPLIGDREKEGDPFGEFEASVLYPRSHGSHPEWLKCAQEIINQQVFDTLISGPVEEALLKKRFSEFKADYLSTREMWDDSSDAFMFSWTESSGMSVFCNQAPFLSMSTNYYVYSGGAHGNYGSYAFNADLGGCQTLNPLDAFYTDQIKKVSALLEKKVRVQRSVPDDVALSDYFFVDEILPTENALISPGGIEFIYNPYEIASYADGQIRIFLSWKELKGTLNPDFPLYKHFILR